MQEYIVTITSEHAIFANKQETQAICENFLKASNIDFVNYARIYPNDTLTLVTTFPDTYPQAIKDKTINTSKNLNAIIEKNKGISSIKNAALYMARWDNQAKKCLKEKYDFGDIVVITFKKKQYFECFCFGEFKAKSHTKNVANFCFNHLDTIIKFRHYFVSKANKLIDTASSNKIILNHGVANLDRGDNLTEFNQKQFQSTIQPKYYTLYHNNEDIHVSNREFECLKYLAHGRTKKETAKFLDISPRTVENYEQRLQRKLKVNSSSKLIDVYLSSDLSVL